jgi:hypothetical protein
MRTSFVSLFDRIESFVTKQYYFSVYINNQNHGRSSSGAGVRLGQIA